ncbi:hypothetical protein KQI82_12490 [Oscillibacter sp. MSJ-2]|uniref:HTH luxR-type domain-containing protein n=1 Tax=Dysosmobacter acutus TaxID=2841504 RepID=A0ABS6FBQ5_9FIRM|nr:hypothetical protein [Dysosmobacter acutus]MBU5627728.1 hypothetical protein [Dysosmobacter acutus]
MKPIEQETIERIRSLTLAGKSAEEVSVLACVSAQTVRTYRQKLGLPPLCKIRKELRAQGRLETRCNDAYHASSANLCFDCVHAVSDNRGHGCPWTIDAWFREVPGWTVRRYQRNGKEYVQILHCPMFERG